MPSPTSEASLNIPTLDLVIIVVYLLGIMAVGMWSVRRQKLSGETYFLAGRSLRWPMIGAALFASNISTIHLVGLAASGYNEGLVWGNFEWMASFTLILLGLVFAPFYFRTRISTLPEFLERRYNSTARTILAFMAILGALFIHIGMSLYAGAAVFEQFFGINVMASIVIISVITAIYTVFGGLKAVMVTEAIQAVLLLFGAILVTVFVVMALPERADIHNLTQFRAALKPDQLTMLHANDSAGLAWYAVLLGYPVLGVWYWCSDQTIVQRVLGANSQRDAQNGALFAGLLKILPVFLMVFPGVCAYAVFKDKIGDDANQTLLVLINELVPTGLKGLIAAGLLAALMSTIAAALNSSATLVAVDIVKRIWPETSDRKQVRIGQWAAVGVMLVAMAWSTQGGRYSSIFEGINAIAACLAPPITVCFVWGVFWRRGTAQAAVTTMVLGFAMGATAFLVDLPLIPIYHKQVLLDGVTTMVPVKLITEVWGIPFMMQAWWGFCLCSLIFVIVSLCTPPPPPEKIDGLTWKNPWEVLFYGRITGIGDPRVLAGLLSVLMVILYVIFR